MIFTCNCFGEGKKNNLLCWLHYMKLLHNLIQISKFYGNIKDQLSSHALGTLNSYLTLTLYYLGLYFYIELLDKDEKLLIYLALIYPLSDIIILIVTFFIVRRNKAAKAKLEEESAVKYAKDVKETKEKLKEIMYLPIDYESDIAEDEDE